MKGEYEAIDQILNNNEKIHIYQITEKIYYWFKYFYI